LVQSGFAPPSKKQSLNVIDLKLKSLMEVEHQAPETQEAQTPKGHFASFIAHNEKESDVLFLKDLKVTFRFIQ